MENGRKWSWKVLENAHKKVRESHRKRLSVFCMHPVFFILFCILTRATEVAFEDCASTTEIAVYLLGIYEAQVKYRCCKELAA